MTQLAFNLDGDGNIVAAESSLEDIVAAAEAMEIPYIAQSHLVDGPEVAVTFKCGHVQIDRFIQTTQEYLDFIADGPCHGCWENSKL